MTRTGQPAELVTDYRTKRALAERFARHSSARLLVIAALAGLGVRAAAGFDLVSIPGLSGWHQMDAVAMVIALVMVGPVEWFAHQVLFHAPDESVRARRYKTGASHKRHHVDPTDMAWVLLHPRGARDLMIGVAVVSATWSLPLALVGGVGVAGPWLSTAVLGWLAIVHYEWTHLLVHSRYRPKSRYYRRLAQNHRLHHYRNETFWLGVTTNSADRLFGTLPRTDAEVPLSATARTLSSS